MSDNEEKNSSHNQEINEEPANRTNEDEENNENGEENINNEIENSPNSNNLKNSISNRTPFYYFEQSSGSIGDISGDCCSGYSSPHSALCYSCYCLHAG